MNNSRNRAIITDSSLMDAAKDLNALMQPGYINVDYTDIGADDMIAVITSASASGVTRMTEVFNNIRKSTVWEDFDINASEKMLIKILCAKSSAHPITAEEMSLIVEFSSKLPCTVNFKWAIGVDPSLGESVKVIVFASGQL